MTDRKDRVANVGRLTAKAIAVRQLCLRFADWIGAELS